MGWEPKSAVTLARWHVLFRSNGGLFNNPLSNRFDKNRLPPFLDLNPSVRKDITEFCRLNVDRLSVELLHNHLISDILPGLAKERNTDVSKLLKTFRLRKLSFSTVLRWMHALGFRYCTRKQTHYVDNHERPDTKRYRKQYGSNYMNLEKNMHRFIQLTEEEVGEYVEKENLLLRSGRKYFDRRSKKHMYEFHVDVCESFLEKCEKETEFSGYLSKFFGCIKLEIGLAKRLADSNQVPHDAGILVEENGLEFVYVPAKLCSIFVNQQHGKLKDGRMISSLKPIVILGHDECIFKQYQFTKRTWVSDKGTSGLLPKDDGIGIMVSAFQSPEVGFAHRDFTVDELRKINDHRRGKQYLDREAAKKVYKSLTYKPVLKSNPFCVYFEYGTNKQGYWTYDHFVLQCEDVIDCLEVLYPSFKFIFSVDHSCGHDRQRPDGLNAREMNKYWGGKQRIMHSTLIKSKEGYLGPYNPILKPGDTQDMIFSGLDRGPFYMDAAEREMKRKPCKTGNTITRDRTKKEILELMAQKLNVDMYRRKPESEIKTLARAMSISLTVSYEEEIAGWEGRAKGLLQVLCERGFIDESNLSSYNISGSKDKHGNINNTYSLLHIMSECEDFSNETTLLQDTLGKRDVSVIRTPKCHPELAGEGIEYSWGFAKNAYRRILMEHKSTKEKYLKSVKSVLSRDILNQLRICKFAKHARSYTCAYVCLDNKSEEATEFKDEKGNLVIELTSENIFPSIERLRKQFKTHRCALDFDMHFCKTE